MLKNQVGAVRIKQGRNAKTSFCIVDAQSVKNTDSARNKGYDADKKVPGINRPIFVDSQGLPHTITVTLADVPIAKKRWKTGLSKVSSLLVDGGYTGQYFAKAVHTSLCASVQVAQHQLIICQFGFLSTVTTEILNKL